MNRLTYIDLLRFIGLSLIILAHVQAPSLILQIRTFDVPMMFFVSGLAYSGRKADFSVRFLWHRFKRLIIPVYIFLICYYSLHWLFQHSISMDEVRSSFLLIGGISYLWIIRVFLLIGLLTPLLLYIEGKIKKSSYLYICLIIWLVLWQVIISLYGLKSNTFVRQYIFYAAGYSVLFIWGLRIRKSTNKTIIYSCVLTMILFLGLLCYLYTTNNGQGLAINSYKYPPRLYFLSYGLFMSLALYYVAKKSDIQSIPSIIQFIGSNTIWIYLYHIPIIPFVIHLFPQSWLIQYLLIYILAVALCFLQVKIIETMEKKGITASIFKYLRG